MEQIIVCEDHRILIGDVIECLKGEPDESVQMVVTSPPYWNLRDYQTGRWEGGNDPACDHKAGKEKSRYDYALDSSPIQDGSRTGTDAPKFKAVCPTCGAKRIDDQIGLEATPAEFVEKLVKVFREVKRVLRKDGVAFVNIGDSYCSTAPGTASDPLHQRGIPAGLKPKDLCLIPWRLALALQDDGWYVRDIICWAKKSPMPESIQDRCTKSWEPIIMLTKSESYFCDMEAVRTANKEQSIARATCPSGGGIGVGGSFHDHTDDLVTGQSKNRGSRLNPSGANLRNVWYLGSESERMAHFACFPSEIPRRCILMGTSERGCCPKCSAPWERIMESEKLTRERPNDYTKREGQDGTGNSCANSVAGVSVTTIGWRPGCKCYGVNVVGDPPTKPAKRKDQTAEEHERNMESWQLLMQAWRDGVDAALPEYEKLTTVPCRVLDPFMGSGTVNREARRLGRASLGCELNPNYVREIAIRKIEMAFDSGQRRPEKKQEGQKSLFDDAGVCYDAEHVQQQQTHEP